MSEAIAKAIAERDRILLELDFEAAKAFVLSHGGKPTPDDLNWETAVHLARIEVTNMPEFALIVSRAYIAKVIGAGVSIENLPAESPFVDPVLDLIFPHDLTEDFMAGRAR